MMTVIRSARAEDAACFASLEARAVSHPWSERQYSESIVSHHCHALEVDGVVRGCLVFTRVLDDVELLGLVIDPEFQGRGLGRMLMDYLLNTNHGLASRIFLEVRAGNRGAIHLYTRMGFTEQGRRKHYYPAENGREDALIMVYSYE